MNLSTPSHYPGPPRLLLGVTLMVWGYLTNHALLALGAALLVESRHWLNWRWPVSYTHLTLPTKA